ncbi:MAG: dodecin family protein [Nitrososphaerales archaeon]
MIRGSPKSWEEAVQSVVKEAAKESSQISRVYVENLSCVVKEGKVVEYRASVRLIMPV